MTLQQLEKFYEDCMRTGKLPDNGLCCCLDKEDVDLFKPTPEDGMLLLKESLSKAYWGSGFSDIELFLNHDLYYAFTPIRQTIVLFLIEIKRYEKRKTKSA